MNIEIERKFTVNKIPNSITNSILIEQFYMLIDDNFVQRLRLFDDKEAIISLKQNCSGWTFWLLSGNPKLTKFLKMKASLKIPINNGGIDCRWIKYYIN